MVLFGLVLSEDSISKETRRRDIIDGLQNLPELIKQVLNCDQQIHDYAQALFTQSSLLVMGRGYNFATCLEGALVRKLLRHCIPLRESATSVIFFSIESERTDLHALRRNPGR